jgi:LmbE family N-acetylglucosaminyl deacetylase
VSGTSASSTDLVVVLAHPDDESLACGGILARCADEGLRVTLVCATRGERGPADHETPPAQVPDRRERELAAAARALGVARVRFLGYTDGMLRWADERRLESDIEQVLVEEQPRDVITFGRDGLYWHPDHVALSDRVFAAALRATPCPAVSCVVMPPGAMAGLVDAVRRRRPDARPTLWGVEPSLFGHGALAHEFLVDVRNVIERKVAALRCHRSQLPAGHPLSVMTMAEARRWLGHEAFHAAPVDGLPASVLLPRLAAGTA